MTLKILAVSGSLRKASTNTGLIRALHSLSIKNTEFKVLDISQVPMFNEDLEHPETPSLISQHCQQILQCDGILFATPCCNFNISSPLKNYLDWISRGKSPLFKKPTGYIHSGMMLSDVVDTAFINTVTYVQANVYKGHNFKVKATKENFDENGDLTNQQKINELKEYLNGFEDFITSSSKSA